jgi:nucleoside-diphosphate-sugar epimerase
MNILITGAFGFVGTNISEAIKNEFNPHLIAVDILESNNHIYNEFVEWKAIDKLEWDNLDAVIHLAGKAHDTKNTTEDKTYFDINLGLTQQIFEYFLKSNARKFIFFSSVKAVADQVNGEQLTEEDIPNPQTAYGKSKLAAENYILDTLQNLSHNARSGSVLSDKKVYILRPCMIHGPGNKGNLNLLHKLVQKGIPWPLGNFNNKRSFTSMDNLAFVINRLLQTDIAQGIYQMADDEVISTNRLIDLIAVAKGKKSRIWNINKKMIRGFANMGDIFHLPLNSERLKKLTESYVVSNKKIKQALDIESMPVSAEEGMRKTLQAF